MKKKQIDLENNKKVKSAFLFFKHYILICNYKRERYFK